MAKPPGQGSPTALWTQNALVLLRLLSTHGQLGRPELTDLSGLARTTVVQTTERLSSLGIIEISGIDHERRGPAATLYRLTPSWATGIAVDVGHRRIRAQVLDFAGNSHWIGERDSPSSSLETGDLVAAVKELTSGIEASFVTIGVPGAVSPFDRTVTLAEGIAGQGRQLATELDQAFGVRVDLHNDVNLAAIAESASSDLADFAYISLGYGIGAAFVHDGVLLPGSHGAAGELAYLPGTPWRERGPIGEESLAYHATELGYPYSGSKNLFVDHVSGDPLALKMVDDLASRLAQIITTVTLVTDPGAIVLAGSIGGEPAFRHPLELALDKLSPRGKFTLNPSSLGTEAVLQGASIQLVAQMQQNCFADCLLPLSSIN